MWNKIVIAHELNFQLISISFWNPRTSDISNDSYLHVKKTATHSDNTENTLGKKNNMKNRQRKIKITLQILHTCHEFSKLGKILPLQRRNERSKIKFENLHHNLHENIEQVLVSKILITKQWCIVITKTKYFMTKRWLTGVTTPRTFHVESKHVWI